MAIQNTKVGIDSRASTRNIVVVVITGLLALLLAQQVATGWIPLGERLNISRRDFNIVEIVVIVAAALWGLFTLWTATSLLRPQPSTLINDYFDGGPMPKGLRYGVGVLAIMGVVCVVIAVQILTGWIPLGERINISRRDLNIEEWFSIVLALVWGGACLRTVLGFLRRERPAWSWGQWILFAGIAAGITLLLSGLFDIRDFAQRTRGPANIADVLQFLLPGILLILTSLIAYRFTVIGYSDVGVRKDIAGTLAERARARDITGKRTPAGQTIRNRLAKSPSAGAIIGFVGVFMLFSISTDLFLQSQSLASALTNNITRGVVALGTTILMISGEFDLSVGSLLGIGGLAFMGLITGAFPPGVGAQHPIVAAILAVGIVCFFGFMNGFILVRTGIPSFIVTLSTLLMLRAIPLVFIAGGKTLRYIDYFSDPPDIRISRILVLVLALIFGVAMAFIARSMLPPMYRRLREQFSGYAEDPGDFRTLSLGASTVYFVGIVFVFVAILLVAIGGVLDQLTQLGQGSNFIVVSFFDLLNGRITALPLIGEIPINVNLRVGVVWWFIMVIIFNFVLEQTRYGNACFAVGGNPGAARAQGINVNRVKIINYTLVAFLCGVAALFNAARLQSIDSLSGQGLELEVIAATVIGGTLLSGGYGSIIGALLGVFIFGMMQTGLVQNNIDARLFDGVIGVIILVSVIINTWSRRIRA
ncbi:MAG: ABC transporter permease [Anaerolineae bacterium]